MKFNLAVISIAVIALLVTASLIATPISGSDGSDEFLVRDGMGHSCTFDGPVNKVISIGKGPTSSIIRMGCIDKIVLTDSYSAVGSDGYLSELRSKEGIIFGGDMYSDFEYLKMSIMTVADHGMFDKNNDVVIVTGGGKANTENLYGFLKAQGFSKVLTWTSANSYEEIVDFTKSLSKIVTGEITEDAERMSETTKHVNYNLYRAGITHGSLPKCFAIRFSPSSGWQVSNYGSLATSMMMKAGGNVVTLDNDKSSNYYSIAHPSELISKYGTDVIVFADSTIMGGVMEELRSELGYEVKICPMDPMWNNYGFESMEGVYVMTHIFVVDHFNNRIGGQVPECPVYVNMDDNDISWARTVSQPWSS